MQSLWTKAPSRHQATQTPHLWWHRPTNQPIRTVRLWGPLNFRTMVAPVGWRIAVIGPHLMGSLRRRVRRPVATMLEKGGVLRGWPQPLVWGRARLSLLQEWGYSTDIPCWRLREENPMTPFWDELSVEERCGLVVQGLVHVWLLLMLGVGEQGSRRWHVI